MTENTRVAQRIMQIREEQNISQKDFAIMIDMSKSTYSDKENGKTELTINELYRIAKGLKVSISNLLGIESSIIQNNQNGSIVLTQNNHGTIYFEPSKETINKIKES